MIHVASQGNIAGAIDASPVLTGGDLSQVAPRKFTGNSRPLCASVVLAGAAGVFAGLLISFIDLIALKTIALSDAAGSDMAFGASLTRAIESQTFGLRV